MKNKLFLIIALLPLCLCAQTTPTKISGEIKELSVSPDSSVWLVSDAGIIYWIKDLDKDVDIKLKLPEPKPDYFGEKKINMERISFFNKDTFFLSGYLGNDLNGEKRDETNKIYLTRDGGKKWDIVEFSKSGCWVYDSYASANGEAWFGGSEGDIFHTSDYGANWEKLSSPFNSSSRMACIYVNGKSGLVGALGNELKSSSDGLKTFQKMKTPKDKKKYTTDSKDVSLDDRFMNVSILNNNYIVDQQSNVFYSSTALIDWKSTVPKLVKFDVKPDSSQVIGLTSDNKIVAFSKDLVLLRTIATIPAKETVIDLQVRNNEIYLLTATYAKPKKGDDVEGTIGNMQVVRVGYKKVATYLVYRISGGKVKKHEFVVG